MKKYIVMAVMAISVDKSSAAAKEKMKNKIEERMTLWASEAYATQLCGLV